MTHWRFDPIFGSYAIPLLAFACLGGLLWLSPQFARLANQRRWVLVALRALLLLLLVLAMLRPTRISSSSQPQSAVLVLLVDQSRSMQLPHVAGGESRWDAQRQALAAARNVLLEMPKNIEVRLYSYDSVLQPLDFRQPDLGLPDLPVGEQTDIGSSLDEALQRERGKRIAAVILLGDGTQTAFAPRVEIQDAGRELAQLDYPLYTIALGPTGNLAEARDVAVENLPEQYSVFVKNELLIRAQLRIRGYVNQDIPVQLTVENLATGKKQELGPRPLRVPSSVELERIEFPLIPDEVGQYKLTLRAAPQPGELVVKNNELTSFLTVRDGGLRVLYLYGDLVGEQRLLRRSLNESAEIQLDDIYLDPRQRDRWPVSLDEYLVPPQIDAVLMESVDAAALGESNLKAITQAVEGGRGLMMIGGFHSFGPGGYANTPLAAALPVTMGRLERQEFGFDRPISRDLHWWEDLPTLAVRPHSVTQLTSAADNDQAWRELPPLRGANRFQGLKDGAQVLLESPNQVPLLVAGEYGRGRVLAFAGNTTARWWQRGHASAHRRFWRQGILWLTQRDENEQNDVWIKLAQRRYQPGANVTFRAGINTSSGEPIPGATFTAELVAPSGERSPVPLSPQEAEVAGQLDRVRLPGDYLLEVTARRDDKELGRARADFQILDRDVEFSNPAADHDLLARLAKLTAEAGGRPLAPEQLPGVLREIQQQPSQLAIQIQSKWRLGDTALDAWLFFLAVVGLLTAEWTLRKKWGLV